MDINEIVSSTKFCHYTTIENTRNIISSNCFYLSKMSLMNDQREVNIHKSEKDQIFSLSFCHSDAINIPLFYLYSGIDGKGCRIQFTNTKIRSIVDNCTIHYVNNKMKKLKKTIPSDEYSIYYDWVYYISDDGYCFHKGEDDKQYASFENAKKVLKKDNKHYFIKNPIWKFEKEFRIVVKFRKPVRYDRISLEFDIKENEKSISIMCAPELTENEFNEITEEFKDYGISKVNMPYDLGVSMNLVQRNRQLLTV